MESDEIRAVVDQARCLCANISPHDTSWEPAALSRLLETLAQLADCAESLLAEREAFAGRLRRTPASRAADAPPLHFPQSPSQTIDEVTPSPPSDV